jgi:hypothetical protein
VAEVLTAAALATDDAGFFGGHSAYNDWLADYCASRRHGCSASRTFPASPAAPRTRSAAHGRLRGAPAGLPPEGSWWDDAWTPVAGLVECGCRPGFTSAGFARRHRLPKGRRS